MKVNELLEKIMLHTSLTDLFSCMLCIRLDVLELGY